ncbi:hypothetical protein IFR05_006076 [Cadophora sp. M221]|nr:hypothetical protein IFR05_006076 [Cadophora sp. M221]
MSSFAPYQEVASTTASPVASPAASPELQTNSQSPSMTESALNSDSAGVSNNGDASTAPMDEESPAGEEEVLAQQVKEPSDKFLTECETVEEVLDALSDGFNKHQDDLRNFDFKPIIDFRSEEIVTAAQLFACVGQKAFNAGFRRAKEDAADLRMQRRILNLEEKRKAAVEEAARRWAEEEAEDGHADEKADLAGGDDQAQPTSLHQIAIQAQSHNPVYHAFGASPGLYIGTDPPVSNQADSDQADDDQQSDNGPSAPKRVSKPARKPASRQTRKKTSKAKSRIEKGLVGQSRQNQRTAASKSRNDWGIPRPHISKADFFALRRHARLTTKAFDKLGPNDINNVKLTHREAIRYSNASDTWTYVKEVGVNASENKIIDDHLCNWELVTRRKIRRKLKLRVQGQRRGDFHDSDSSISDDEGQYGSDIDRDEILDSSELIVDDETEEDDEEDEEEAEEQVRRKNKGKSRAVVREDKEADDEEDEDDGGESRQISQAHDESPEESEEE